MAVEPYRDRKGWRTMQRDNLTEVSDLAQAVRQAIVVPSATTRAGQWKGLATSFRQRRSMPTFGPTSTLPLLWLR